MRERLTITLPLPPKALSPNARSHWAKKARAVKEYRARAWAEARRQGQGSMWRRAEVRLTFRFRQVRRRDPDNLVASMKAALDGLRDAGVIADDDGLVILPPRVVVDRECSGVEVEVSPLP